MKTVCSWCGITLVPGPDAPVSHGACAPCAEAFLGDLCPACNGMGVPAGGDEIDTYYPCPECGGSGMRKKVAA